MQNVIPFPVLVDRKRNLSLRQSFKAARDVAESALCLGLQVLRAIMTAPPEQERIEEHRARYARVTGHF